MGLTPERLVLPATSRRFGRPRPVEAQPGSAAAAGFAAFTKAFIEEGIDKMEAFYELKPNDLKEQALQVLPPPAHTHTHPLFPLFRPPSLLLPRALPRALALSLFRSLALAILRPRIHHPPPRAQVIGMPRKDYEKLSAEVTIRRELLGCAAADD